MDRREALKKLAAGTVLTMASPIILRSTAFADSGTVSCLPSPFPSPNSALASALVVESLSQGDAADFVRLRIPEGSAALTSILCPSGFTKLVQYRWSLISAPGATTFFPNAVNWGASNQVRVVSDGSNNTLGTSGTYQVQVQVRVACQSQTRVCWRCTIVTVSFDWAYDATLAPSVVSNVSKTAASGDETTCNQQPPSTLP